MNNPTNDLSKFTKADLKEAGELLTAYANDNMTKLARDYLYEGVQVFLNTNSWNVFLCDSDYNCAMFNSDGELDLFISTPYNGTEGFYDEIMENYDKLHDEDKEYMDNLKAKLA